MPYDLRPRNTRTATVTPQDSAVPDMETDLPQARTGRRRTASQQQPSQVLAKKRQIADESEGEEEELKLKPAKRQYAPKDEVSEGDAESFEYEHTTAAAAPDRGAEPAQQGGTGPQAPAPAASNPPYKPLDMADMEAELTTTHGLVADPVDEPKEVSVGAVVWNINHLGGDETALVKEDKPAAPRRYANKTYQKDDIKTQFGTLQNAIHGSAKEFKKAANAEIRYINGAPGTKHAKDARAEISQFLSDISALPKVDTEIISTGIDALNSLKQPIGNQTASERGTLFQQLRALNRVWNRLVRLRVVLSTGKDRPKPEKGEKQSPKKKKKKVNEDDDREDWHARRAFRGVLDRMDVSGSVKVALTDLLNAKLPPRDLQQAVADLKREIVLGLTTDKFFRNPAVNLVLINEMNLGQAHLAAAAEKQGLGVSLGPAMLALGQPLRPESKSKSTVTTTTDAGKQRFGGKQFEYYPAVHRQTGPNALQFKGTFYVTTAGKFVPQDYQAEKNLAIPWNKIHETFRGIVVHRYAQKGQEFWAGVLHTTPAGSGLDRRNIWPQIKDPLEQLNVLAKKFKIPLLVGGDFYISGEALVNKPGQDPMDVADDKEDDEEPLAETAEEGEEKAEESPDADDEVPAGLTAADAKHLGQTKARHLARNIYLKAAADETSLTLLKLFRNVQSGTADAPGRSREPEFRPKAGIIGVTGGRDIPLSWESYVALIEKYFTLPELGEQFDVNKARAVLAPGMGFEDVSWHASLAGGKVSSLDIRRNNSDAAVTMVKGASALGYTIVESGGPTNPKEKVRGEDTEQLADLFLVNQYWQTTQSAVVLPDDGRLRRVDTRKLTATRTYWKTSDHSPAVMLGSTKRNDPQVFNAFERIPQIMERARQASIEANQHEWIKLKSQLSGVPTALPLETDLELIRLMLRDAIDAPNSHSDDVRGLVANLLQSVLAVDDAKLTPEQRQGVELLKRWGHPWYTINWVR